MGGILDPYEYRGNKVPCHKCSNRVQNCHASCENYIAYAKRRREINHMIQAGREQQAADLGRMECTFMRKRHI